MRPEELAAAVGRAMRLALAPLVVRMKALEEDRTASGAELTRARQALEAGQNDLRIRMAALETREPVPGPPGPPGPAGVDGKDGAAGLRYLGVYVAGKAYGAGEIVTYGGSAWHCASATTATPGTSHAWQLMVKRGRDSREARP